MPKTLSEKVWDRHVVHRAEGEPDLLYVDLHLVHEVTSPQAFDGLRMSQRAVIGPFRVRHLGNEHRLHPVRLARLGACGWIVEGALLLRRCFEALTQHLQCLVVETGSHLAHIRETAIAFMQAEKECAEAQT